MNHHMPAGPGQSHIPPTHPSHPHSRRHQDYHAYHQAQHPPPIHLGHFVGLPQHPYYSHPPAQPPFPPARWPPQFPPQHFIPPPPPQPQAHPSYQPRSPVVVTSQPYAPAMTPITRQPPMPVPSSRPLTQSPQPPPEPNQQFSHPSPVPVSSTETSQQERAQEQGKHAKQDSTTIPSVQERTRRPSVNPLSLPPQIKTPYYPELPWYSVPEGRSAFPPRALARKRRPQSLREIDDVALPIREGMGELTAAPAAEDLQSETSTIAARSEPDTPATSQAPSESEFTQVSTPSTPAQFAGSSPKTTPTQISHVRKDTNTAIAVPNIMGLAKPRISPPVAEKRAPSNNAVDDTTPTPDGSKTMVTDAEQPAKEATPPTLPAKPAPRSWAELVGSKASPNQQSGQPNGSVEVNGMFLPKSASLADALRQYNIQSDAKLSFLEPRGLVNTGNMCYMNSILQVLIFCVPFYNFLEQVRQRTIHSIKSDTPLIDAMIMFMREFKVLASAESVDILRHMLKPEELEKYGEPVTPEYVYDAIRKLARFNSMRRGHQQDAEEFLGFLLEGLHDECVAVIQGQPEPQPQSNGVTSPSEATSPGSAEGWLEVGPKQKAAITRHAGSQDVPSPITKIFGGNLRSELRVPGQKDSVTLEPYKPLQLDIGAPHVNNIVDALRGLTRTEALMGDFGGRTNSAKKQVFIDTLPTVLILHLKRFQYENNLTGTQKIGKKVGYPLELEIPKEVFPPSKRASLAVKGRAPKYRLISVVYHHGKSAAGGHYTVDVLREDGREWVRMDDTVIRRVRPQDVAEGGAEEDPKLLARALEQHKVEQELQKQRNMYQGLDERDEESAAEEMPWSEVNGHVPGHRKWNSVAPTNGTATPASTTGKKTPTARKEGVRDNKVAYILFYERVRH